jgi:addiction module RelB/DinJ family antitoxin
MPVKEAVVRARVDQKLKLESELILQRLGLTTTEAIRMLFAQIKLRGGLPFQVVLEPSQASSDDLLLPASKRQAAIDALYDD